jgi:hypothetical protein
MFRHRRQVSAEKESKGAMMMARHRALGHGQGALPHIMHIVNLELPNQ